MHFTAFDEIDWHAALELSAVEIFVAPVVLHELDRLKQDKASSRLRSRARTIIRKLAANEETGQPLIVRDGVKVLLLSREPARELFDQKALDPSIGDDHAWRRFARA